MQHGPGSQTGVGLIGPDSQDAVLQHLQHHSQPGELDVGATQPQLTQDQLNLSQTLAFLMSSSQGLAPSQETEALLHRVASPQMPWLGALPVPGVGAMQDAAATFVLPPPVAEHAQHQMQMHTLFMQNPLAPQPPPAAVAPQERHPSLLKAEHQDSRATRR